MHLITLNVTQALGRTPLVEGSACRRKLYLATHNIEKRRTSMPLAGFEPAIQTSERPQTNVLARAPIGVGKSYIAT